MKNRILTIISLALCCGVSVAWAQSPSARKGEGRPSFEHFLQQKTAFIVAEMKLPAADSARFVAVFTELQQQKGQLWGKYAPSGRRLRAYQREHKGQPVPDSLYLRAVRDEAQLSLEDAQLEQQYLKRLEEVLSPQQLFDYVRAEKKFKSTFMAPKRQEPKK